MIPAANSAVVCGSQAQAAGQFQQRSGGAAGEGERGRDLLGDVLALAAVRPGPAGVQLGCGGEFQLGLPGAQPPGRAQHADQLVVGQTAQPGAPRGTDVPGQFRARQHDIQGPPGREPVAVAALAVGEPGIERLRHGRPGIAVPVRIAVPARRWLGFEIVVPGIIVVRAAVEPG